MKNLKKLFMLLLLLIVPFMLVGCGDNDDDDDDEERVSEKENKKDKEDEKEEKESKKDTKKSSKVQTISCVGESQGVDIVVTYSYNESTDEVLQNTFEYTVTYPASAASDEAEKTICKSYEQSNFINCHVRFDKDNDKAIITVTPETDVFKGRSFEDVQKELAGINLTCSLK